MKQYDKNSLIGLLLMGFILIIFNTYFFPQVEVAETEKKDTTEIVTTINKAVIEQSETEIIANAIVDSIINKQYVNQYGIFANTAIGSEQESILENDKLKIRDRFWKTFISLANKSEKIQMQNLISKINFSSHMMVVCKK